MIHGLIERNMEIKGGEVPLTKHMRKGFFQALGSGDPFHQSRFVGVDCVEEPARNARRFRICPSLVLVNKLTGKESEPKPVGTMLLADEAEATRLAEHMGRPQAIQRANRTLEVVENIRLNAALVGAGGAAVAAVLAVS